MYMVGIAFNDNGNDGIERYFGLVLINFHLKNDFTWWCN